MSEDNKVTIQYTSPSLINKFSSRPVKVPVAYAKECESKGWAKILSSFPIANPSIEPEEEKKVFKVEEKVEFMPETKMVSNVVWIAASGNIDATTRKVGSQLGIESEIVTPGYFSNSLLLKADLLILNSDMRGFTISQTTTIRAILFQKKYPFVLRMSDLMEDYMFMRQCLLFAKFVCFESEKVMDKVIEFLGDESVQGWFIEDRGNYYDFWRNVSEVLQQR